MPSDKALDGRIALVTGASRGIGYAVALELARAGAHVVALARTVGGLEDLDDAIRADGGTATLVPVDLKDMPALDRLGASIHERWGRLDILVGNAGILGTLSPVGHIREKDWDAAMTINVTANWRLLRSLDPLLRASDAGRAVFVTSGASFKARPFWATYATTKAALETLVRTYAAEVEKMGVKANLFSPGPVRTAMRAKAMPGEDPETLPAPADVAPAFLPLVSAELEHTGLIYNWPSRSWIEPQPPKGIPDA